MRFRLTYKPAGGENSVWNCKEHAQMHNFPLWFQWLYWHADAHVDKNFEFIKKLIENKNPFESDAF